MIHSSILRLIAVLTMLSFLSCASPRNVRVSPLYADDPIWLNRTPKEPINIIVTEGDLKRKYIPFAKITVDSTGRDKERSFDRMRAEAAEIGADAVIKITISSQYEGQSVNLYTGQNYGPRNRHTLEGIAVKFSDN